MSNVYGGMAEAEAGNLGRLDRHLGLITSAAIFGFVVSQVLFVSEMNLTTALTVVSEAGAVDVVLGVLVASHSIVILILYLICDAWRRSDLRGGRDPRLARTLQFVFAILALAFAPVVVAVVFGVATLTFDWSDDRSERKRGYRPHPWGAAGTLAISLFFASLVMAPAVWLPAEVITSDQLQLVGYVLEDESGWMTVLDEETRTVTRFRSTTVSDRTLCKPDEREVTGPVVRFFLDPTSEVPCEAIVDDAG